MLIRGSWSTMVATLRPSPAAPEGRPGRPGGQDRQHPRLGDDAAGVERERAVGRIDTAGAVGVLTARADDPAGVANAVRNGQRSLFAFRGVVDVQVNHLAVRPGVSV
jgi:hypothetical protein